MNDFFLIVNKVIAFMRLDFVLYGFSFSFWDMFIWFMVTGFIISFIVNVLKS